MKNFLDFDFCAKTVTSVFFIPGEFGGSHLHINRKNHCLALHTDGVKKYIFEGYNPITVNKNNIIYLPKHSTYDVEIDMPGDCYAINFDISEELSPEPFKINIKNISGIYDCFKTTNRIWDISRKIYKSAET